MVKFVHKIRSMQHDKKKFMHGIKIYAYRNKILPPYGAIVPLYQDNAKSKGIKEIKTLFMTL